MALSEHEQKAFEQLEQAFYRDEPLRRDEPLFAHRVERSRNALRNDRLRVLLPVAGFAMATVLLFAFCLTTFVVLGVAGMLLMFVSVDALCPKSGGRIHALAQDVARSRSIDGPHNA